MPEDLSVDHVLDVLEGASGSLMCPTVYAMVVVREVRRLQGEATALRDRLDVPQRKEHIEEMRDAEREMRDMQSEINSLERQTDDYGVWGR